VVAGSCALWDTPHALNPRSGPVVLAAVWFFLAMASVDFPVINITLASALCIAIVPTGYRLLCEELLVLNSGVRVPLFCLSSGDHMTSYYLGK